MVSELDKSLSQLVGVDKQESLVQIKWDSLVSLLDVLESIQENIVSVFVVTQLLLLLSNVNCDFDSLSNISDSSIQFEGPLRLFRNVITLTHQVIHQFMG